jgi:hypothetical protein
LIAPHPLLVDDLLRLLIARGVLAKPDTRHRLMYVDPACTDYVVPSSVLATQAEHPCDIATAVLEAFWRSWPECLREAPYRGVLPRGWRSCVPEATRARFDR